MDEELNSDPEHMAVIKLVYFLVSGTLILSEGVEENFPNCGKSYSN